MIVFRKEKYLNQTLIFFNRLVIGFITAVLLSLIRFLPPANYRQQILKNYRIFQPIFEFRSKHSHLWFFQTISIL